MPRLEDPWGDGDALVVDLRQARVLRRLPESPVKRYLRAVGKYGEDHPYTEQCRAPALARVLEQLSDAEQELRKLEFTHPELLTEQEDD